MAENYTGIKVIHTSKENIGLFYRDGYLDLDIFDGRLRLSKHQNLFLVIKDEVPKEQGGCGSALGRVKGSRVCKLNVSDNTVLASVKPRNKEQIFAFEMLMDDNIQAISITGRAGTGKTLIAMATALSKIEERVYDRIILSRPMSQVGKKEIGFLPGSALEKFKPFNQGYMCNFEYLLGSKDTDAAMEQLPVEFVPIQLIRGASWPNSIILIDEAQNLGHLETLTVGTRVGEGSKIIFLGDLNQRDERLSRESTGIFKLTNSPIFKENLITASIELQKCERGPVPTIFSDIFEDQQGE